MISSPEFFNVALVPEVIYATFGLRAMDTSPLSGFESYFKQEPQSSSNSGPNTPKSESKRMVPACSICGTDSTGIHFGVDACAACSAFFRRTVVLDKKYQCMKENQCSVLKGSVEQKCRACRFSKCLLKGMDRNSVQQRRDAIGKYSESVKKESSIDDEPCVLTPSTSQQFSSELPFSSGTPRRSINDFMKTNTPQSNSVHILNPGESPRILVELIIRQKHLYQQRQLFYSDRELEDWFCEPKPIAEQKLYELEDFTKCMFHLWKVEPRLAAEFMNKSSFLEPLNREDKVNLYKNFVIVRQCVEEPFLTWKHGGLEKEWFVMPNRTYIDFTDPEKYFKNGALKDLKLDLETARNLFIPSFRGSMDNVGNLMKMHCLSEVEMIFLLGLVLFDPYVPTISDEGKELLKNLRNRLVQEVFIYIDEESLGVSPEVRLADLLAIVAEIKIHSMKTAENMQILRVFQLIPSDQCFDQLLN